MYTFCLYKQTSPYSNGGLHYPKRLKRVRNIWKFLWMKTKKVSANFLWMETKKFLQKFFADGNKKSFYKKFLRMKTKKVSTKYWKFNHSFLADNSNNLFNVRIQIKEILIIELYSPVVTHHIIINCKQGPFCFANLIISLTHESLTILKIWKFGNDAGFIYVSQKVNIQRKFTNF